MKKKLISRRNFIRNTALTTGMASVAQFGIADNFSFSEQGGKKSFAGGQQLNMKALQNKCIVASSTNKSISKVCDIDGKTVAGTGIWDPNFYSGSLNLEKVFLPTYDYLEQCGAIRKKYGRKVKVTVFHEEEWTIVESVSSDVLINDIIAEFKLKPHTVGLKEAELIQGKARLQS